MSRLSVICNVILTVCYRLNSYPKRRSANARRNNYADIKAQIVAKHLAGEFKVEIKVGMFNTFKRADLGSFPPPMYRIIKLNGNTYAILWSSKMMSEEIGSKPAQAKVYE